MTEWYPGARIIPAHSSRYRKAGRAGWRRVIIHCTDGQAKAERTAAMWKEPGKTSAQFAIGQDGTIVQAVSLADIAWHAHDASLDSVGLEHCCRTPGELKPDDPGLPPSEIQLVKGARLVAWLCREGGFAPSRATILGHAEADPKTTHTGCPTSAGIDLDAYVARVSVFYFSPFA